ncbi:MAG: YncE family protein [Acidobacteriota bacterium]|nr:YncE family protein [Acidobacteriota bacterium]
MRRVALVVTGLLIAAGALFVTMEGVALEGEVDSGHDPDAYTNFEASHVHPIALTPNGLRLLAVNTPDAILEVYDVDGTGNLTHSASISVGLEPVSVVVRDDTEAWVVNHLSDSVSIVDLSLGTTTDTLDVGDEPVDVAFAKGKAFVALAGEDSVKAYSLTDLTAAPSTIDLFGDDPRALAVSPDGKKVYAVVLRSGNQTTVVNANVIESNNSNLNSLKLSSLGLNDIECNGAPPPYPPLPPGITRNPALTDPLDGIPKVSLILKWNASTGQWEDENGVDWSHCLPVRLPDNDLFIIDANNLSVNEVSGLGTTLFDVSVHPGTGQIYVPNTEARNDVRFEHELGVRGHVVDNRLSIVDPGSQHAVTIVDLNTHINRSSDPATNLPERLASVSQPGMMAWASDGSVAYVTAIGSRKVFRIDGTCQTGTCIFGSVRSSPDAVEAGEGPTGVALNEAAGRLYVMNRFSNSIAIVDTASLTKLDELPMHDPSQDTIKNGRRLLYDAIDTSGHGDAACSSCHISGDLDGLAWDLGDPPGEFVPYTTALDNVRFVREAFGAPVACDPETETDCASHDGFDPQKGPMTTQTLRGMLEPLHWRGDRATMNAFNPAFVGLLGKEDVSAIPGTVKGLPDADMELFRQFTLGIAFPPNPFRNVDDSVPNAVVNFADRGFTGNPATGENLFLTFVSDGTANCIGCHALPFGTAGGKLGGVEPLDPTPMAAAALFNGDDDQSPHSDMKIPHLRNMYEKLGPRFGGSTGPPPESKSGFGYSHDGSVPDLRTFFSINVFNFGTSGTQIRDVSAFVLHFPTGTKPAVGESVTIPPGPPPTGTTDQENLIGTLVALGDLNDPNRHCELVASALDGGQLRHFHLDNGLWERDVTAAPVSTTTLRTDADGPVTFLCTPLGSGTRLGGDRDADGLRDFDDCSAADPALKAAPDAVSGLAFDGLGLLTWSLLDGQAGSATTYDVASGMLSDLPSTGVDLAVCLAGDLSGPSYDDTRADPAAGDGYFYLLRGRNACGDGSYGAGRESLDGLACP